jgi:hypothetical protein
MTDLQNFPRTLELLQNSWDTSGGAALREVLWSLYNRHHLTSLWDAFSDLSLAERAEITQLFLMPLEARDRMLTAIFRASGELPPAGYDGGRIDTHPTRTMARLAAEGRADG